jgi:beta-galactosidase
MSFVSSQEFDTRRRRIDLNGRWAFSYDTAGKGLQDGWFKPGHPLPETILVPGCSQSRFHASAGTLRSSYDGLPELDEQVLLKHPCRQPSWYKRKVRIPAAWQGQPVWLHIGGVKPAADIWINGSHAGRTVSSRTPVRCDISSWIRFGSSNDVTIRIDWSQDVFHGLFDILSSWSGLYRSVWVESVPPRFIADIQALPALHPRAVTVRVKLDGAMATDDESWEIAITVRQSKSRCIARAKIKPRLGEPITGLRLPLPDARLWSPDSPSLHTAEVSLIHRHTVVDTGVVRFGLREITTRGFRVLLNGSPIFLRGGCDDQLYPETVCPPADKAFYVTRLRKARQWGFNYTKSCVEIFTKEFLDAADEIGLLVCEEMPLLVRDSIQRSPDRVPSADAIRRDVEQIITSDRNHPSVVIYSMSSELSTPWLENKAWFRFFSQDLPAVARRCHPAALVIDATGTSCGPDTGAQSVAVDSRWGPRDTDLDGSWLQWALTCRPLAGPIPGLASATKPFLFHEFAWITALSDPALVRRFARLPLKPLHVPDMITAARANGQGRQLPELVTASRQLKHALRKQAFELARSEPKAAGYHHWLIHDFPFCAEGVLNEFWEASPDLAASEFRSCNGDTVLVLEHGPGWSFVWGERLPLSVTISHFGAAPLLRPELRWRLRSGIRTLAHGRQGFRALPCGKLLRVRLPRIALPQGGKPARLLLEVQLSDSGRRVTSNRWPLWAFPHVTDDWDKSTAHTVMRVDRLDHAALNHLADGGRVLLINPGTAHPSAGDLPRAEGEPLYRTVPYNMGTTGNMGTVIRPHPALGDFPHEGWCDFAWAPMIDGSRPFRLDVFGCRIIPIIRSIGHMRTMQDKAYLFEISVGKGRLLAASLCMPTPSKADPAARYLLSALVRYLAGSHIQACLFRVPTIDTLVNVLQPSKG